MQKTLYQKAPFWVLFSVLSFVAIGFTVKYFKTAFPIANLELTVDRSDVIKQAIAFAKKYRVGPENYSQSTSFGVDGTVQVYVELEAGGNKAFNEMIAGNLYSPYSWHVRHFKEHETNEVSIFFKPDGTPYGFKEKIAENEPGPSLSQSDARALAQKNASEWGIQLSDYKLIETSKEERQNGRVDYEFVYERPDVKIKEGLYRLKIGITGNKFTELTHFIKVPETFLLRYTEMRSANATITQAGLILRLLLYLLLGCCIGLFLLHRRQWALFKQPLIWSLFFYVLMFLMQINSLPLAWMGYDTALSQRNFLLQFIIGIIIAPLAQTVVFFLSVAAAESLTRKAFGNHLQLWKLWSPQKANSLSVLGRTVGGYLIVGFYFAFVVGFYFFAHNVLGWWSPSDAMVNPNILATYVPWLTPVVNSLHAGFWEECLFRAVPLAGTALIGTYFGRRYLFIALGFVLQILVFGASHAFYATQPSYARLVELIVPSSIFGGVYLAFGLLPSIISHFIFDLVLMAQPLFASQASGSWIDKIFVIVAGLVPLLVIAYYLFKTKAWATLKASDYNSTWSPKDKPLQVQPGPAMQKKAPVLTSRIKRYITALGVAALFAWVLSTPFRNNAPSLSISRKDAIALAQQTLKDRGFTLNHPWRPLARIVGTQDNQDRFVWKESNKDTYERLINNYYLSPPAWLVRFVRFEGSVDERKEEFNVFIAKNGTVFNVIHQLPESQPGATLSETQARKTAHSALIKFLNKEPDALKEVSATPIKLPKRMDWIFIFSEKSVFSKNEGESRIKIVISGNEVVSTQRFIHVPEQWERDDRSQQALFASLSGFCSTLFRLLFLIATILILISGTFRRKRFITIFAPFVGLFIFNIWNNWPGTIALFNIAQPLDHQLFSFFAALSVNTIAIIGILMLLFAFSQQHKTKPLPHHISNTVWIAAAYSGLIALISKITTSMPTWGLYVAWGFYAPALGMAASTIDSFISYSIFFMALLVMVNHLVQRLRLNRMGTVGLWIILGILMIGNNGITSIIGWIVTGLGVGVLLASAYLYIFRFDPALGIIAIATRMIMQAIQQALLGAYPVAGISNLVSTIIITLLASYLYRYFHEQK